MAFQDTYRSRTYNDLRNRSLPLVEGIMGFSSKLTHVESGYGHYGVKWVFLPEQSEEFGRDEDGLSPLDHAIQDLGRELSLISPNIGCAGLEHQDVNLIWAHECTVPSLIWLDERLPQMFQAAQLSKCYLEGWTFEHPDAWQFGLAELIDSAGFDQRLTIPGEL